MEHSARLAAQCRLQWGHRFISVETTRSATYLLFMIRLQWGHRFISVETRISSAYWASGSYCFNGATDLYRWKQIQRSVVVWAWHGFNGATDLYRWKRRGRRGGSGVPGGFNGATDLYRWKPTLGRVVKVAAEAASMGPPIYIGGNMD